MMMTNIFLSFFEISISSSPVVLLLLLLTPLFNKRYAAKWRYWIWIFIALRLIIPYNGWGRELPVIADTFAVIAPAEIFHGYISAFDNGAVTIDRQIWATDESEYWKPEYNEDAGFEVVDVEGEDITYPLREDCTFFILENHYDPTIELDRDAFSDYLMKMENPVLWIFELEDGQIKNICEQYIP